MCALLIDYDAVRMYDVDLVEKLFSADIGDQKPPEYIPAKPRACSITPYSAAISQFWLQTIQDSSAYVTHTPPHPSWFSLEIEKFRYERELLNRLLRRIFF